MAVSSRSQVLSLYKIMLRESQKFNAYNYRTYAIRRIRDAFREKKNVDNINEIKFLVGRATENLNVIRRQVSIGQMYATQKLVIESSGY
ncbi:hypothetical protein GDO86_011277 [Hymenochirus boettgeri]|uniref:Complex 1 LYR protein domain-containing protein n=1 Tax=Hymenochirus boettgeri TaxID=247094 RepID=A0A8T2JFR7_9PIPI|nr:hypothetical protein GDO86_011277 [Hymenochirus boettgeri]KAG8442433.1 hypothetical protein GDO86_011277 [Hymenochirus boettgeri]